MIGVGTDALLLKMEAARLIVDWAFDADKRVREPLAAAGKSAVIPSGRTGLNLFELHREPYRERHLIENFSCTMKQFRAIATRYDKTSRKFRVAIHLAAAIIWLK
jgi:transposase